MTREPPIRVFLRTPYVALASARKVIRWSHQRAVSIVLIVTAAVSVYGLFHHWLVWALLLAILLPISTLSLVDALLPSSPSIETRVEHAERRALDAYIAACLSAHSSPRIPYVLDLRPFASDYYSRFYFSVLYEPPYEDRSVFRDSTGYPTGHGRVNQRNGVEVRPVL